MQNGVLKIKIIEELRGHKVLPVMSYKFDHLLLSSLVWGISLITLPSYIKMILQYLYTNLCKAGDKGLRKKPQEFNTNKQQISFSNRSNIVYYPHIRFKVDSSEPVQGFTVLTELTRLVQQNPAGLNYSAYETIEEML